MDRFWEDDDEDEYDRFEDGDYWDLADLTYRQLAYCCLWAGLAGFLGSVLWQVGVGGWFWSFLKYAVPKF